MGILINCGVYIGTSILEGNEPYFLKSAPCIPMDLGLPSRLTEPGAQRSMYGIFMAVLLGREKKKH